MINTSNVEQSLSVYILIIPFQLNSELSIKLPSGSGWTDDCEPLQINILLFIFITNINVRSLSAVQKVILMKIKRGMS